MYVWGKIELFIISLWLLFVLIIVATIKIPIYFEADWKFIGVYKLLKMNIVPLICIIFLILGWIFMKRLKYKLSGSKQVFMRINKIQEGNFEHLTFLTTYIVPLISLNLTEIRNVIILFMLLSVIGAICVKTHLFYANPTLALLGYHIYIVNAVTRTGSEKDLILISRERLTKDMSIAYRELDEKIYFAGAVK